MIGAVNTGYGIKKEETNQEKTQRQTEIEEENVTLSQMWIASSRLRKPVEGYRP